jgi:hypothetical protein
VINPGDLVCGQCGEGNDPARRFCRRCGASLVQAAVFALPWYKRWWRRITTPKTRKAGDRPKLRRRAFGGAGGGWISGVGTKVLAVAVVALIVLTFVGPYRHPIRHRLSTWYHDVFTSYNPIHPDMALTTATSAAPGHPASFAVDGHGNTSWVSEGRNSGVGQSLTIGLGTQTNVDKIGFLNGQQDNANTFLTQARAAEVRLTFLGGTQRYVTTLTLDDTPNFQSHTVKAKNATRLVVTILSVYQSTPGTHVAIAEVEFWKKS